MGHGGSTTAYRDPTWQEGGPLHSKYNESYAYPNVIKDSVARKVAENRVLQFGYLKNPISVGYAEFTAEDVKQRFAQEQGIEPNNKLLDGQAYVASGAGHTIMAFPVEGYHSRVNSSFSITVPGEGRSFVDMLRLGRRDLPEVFEDLEEAGITVRLAEPFADGTYPNGYPAFHFSVNDEGKLVKDFEYRPQDPAWPTDEQVPAWPAEEAPAWPEEEQPAWPAESGQSELEQAKAIMPPLAQHTGRAILKSAIEAEADVNLPRLERYADLPDPEIGGVTAIGYIYGESEGTGEETRRRDRDRPDDETYLHWEDEEIRDIAGVRALVHGFTYPPAGGSYLFKRYDSEENAPYRPKVMYQDGRAFLSYGETSYGTGFSALSFSINDRPGQQLTFVVRGQGRSFDQILRVAKRDFPYHFAVMEQKGTEVKLAEPVELGDGTVGWPRIGKDGEPLLPIVYIKRSEDGHGYESVRNVLPPLAD